MKITVKPKFIIIFTILTAALLTVAVLFFAGNQNDTPTGKNGGQAKSSLAVPVDAIALFTFPGPEELSTFLYKDDPLCSRLFSGLKSFKAVTERVSGFMHSKEIENEMVDCAISLHYSAKDKVSPLLVINTEGVDKNLLMKSIEEVTNQSTARTFNGIKILKGEGIEYSFTENKLIASTSPIILESSLRHINSGVSIHDNEEFRQAFNASDSSETVLFINHLQTGKLFSAFINRSFFGGAEFISRFSGWSVFKLDSDKYSFELKGFTFENKGIGNYSSVFRGAAKGVSSVQAVLPSDTYLLLDISVKDISGHIKNQVRYKEFYGKTVSEVNKNAINWVESLKAKEVAVALVPLEGELHWLTIIRKKNPWYISLEEKIGIKEKDLSVRTFHNKGYMARVFGEFFLHTSEESLLESGEWIFIGPKRVLAAISAGIFKNFTMEQYLARTKAHILSGKRGSMVTLIVNGSVYRDSLFSYFRDDHAVNLRKRFSDRNIMIAALEISSDKKGDVSYNVFAFADSMAVPLPPVKEKIPSSENLKGGLSPEIPTGPFEVRNFTNGEKEYLEQIPTGGLRLLSKDKKALWTIPFGGKICGAILQIDYFKNGKLQMLFTDANQIYLLDRLGRFVKPFPKRVAQEIIFGPQVYDLKGDGEIAIMLLHKDNILRLYDKTGSPYPMWSDIVLPGRVKTFPELFENGSEKYFILRTESVAEIYTSNGIRVTNLTGNNRLSNNTSVEAAGKATVAVKTVKGRKIFLNLETGNINQGK